MEERSQFLPFFFCLFYTNLCDEDLRISMLPKQIHSPAMLCCLCFSVGIHFAPVLVAEVLCFTITDELHRKHNGCIRASLHLVAEGFVNK